MFNNFWVEICTLPWRNDRMYSLLMQNGLRRRKLFEPSITPHQTRRLEENVPSHRFNLRDHHKILREDVLPRFWTRDILARMRQKCTRCSQRPRVERVKSATDERSRTNFVRSFRIRSKGRRSIILWLLKACPHVRRVARPEACIEIRRRVESSISRRPMRLLRTSPPTKPRSVLRFTMSLR